MNSLKISPITTIVRKNGHKYTLRAEKLDIRSFTLSEPKSDTDMWLNSISSKQMKDLITEYGGLIDAQKLAETLGMRRKLKEIWLVLCDEYTWRTNGLSRECLKSMLNCILYVDDVGTPQTDKEYRDAFMRLDRLVKLEPFLQLYGIERDNYMKFVNGKYEYLTDDEKKIILKALQQRPLDKYATKEQREEFRNKMTAKTENSADEDTPTPKK